MPSSSQRRGPAGRRRASARPAGPGRRRTRARSSAAASSRRAPAPPRSRPRRGFRRGRRQSSASPRRSRRFRGLRCTSGGMLVKGPGGGPGPERDIVSCNTLEAMGRLQGAAMAKDDAEARERNRRLVMSAVKGLREVLPGDSRFGDSLSVGGAEQSQVIARRIAEATAERPSVLREAGLSALQVWDAFTDGPGPPRRARAGDRLHRPGRILELGDEGRRRGGAGAAARRRRCDRAAGDRATAARS